jgi:hypothetical protein
LLALLAPSLLLLLLWRGRTSRLSALALFLFPMSFSGGRWRSRLPPQPVAGAFLHRRRRAAWVRCELFPLLVFQSQALGVALGAH